MSRRLRAAYERAGLKPLSGGLWHPFRRKFATERKHLPLPDVAVAGGWKEPRTLLECYTLRLVPRTAGGSLDCRRRHRYTGRSAAR